MAPIHDQYFQSIDSRDGAVINTATAVRNFLAHRSESSKERMNIALSVGGLTNSGLKRGSNNIHNVGVYLKAKSTGMRPRVVIFIDRLTSIAAKLA